MRDISKTLTTLSKNDLPLIYAFFVPNKEVKHSVHILQPKPKEKSGRRLRNTSNF